VRPFRARGDTFQTGAIVALDPLDAASAIESGRAVLADPADFAALRDAVHAANRLALKKAGPVRGEPGGPWRKL